MVLVEIAEHPEERRRGLAGRAHLHERAGMLFWMGQRADHAFWGRGLLIPLDMLFVDFDRVVGVSGVNAGDETQVSMGRPSSAVLEVNRGWVTRHGVEVGDLVRISAA